MFEIKIACKGTHYYLKDNAFWAKIYLSDMNLSF